MYVCMHQRVRERMKSRSREGRSRKEGGRDKGGGVCASVCTHRSEKDTGCPTLSHSVLFAGDRVANWTITRMAGRKCRSPISTPHSTGVTGRYEHGISSHSYEDLNSDPRTCITDAFILSGICHLSSFHMMLLPLSFPFLSFTTSDWIR